MNILVTKIQSLYRSYKYKKEFNKIKKYILIIQNNIRVLIAKNKLLLLKKNKSQKIIKYWFIMIKQKILFKKIIKNITIIQKKFKYIIDGNLLNILKKLIMHQLKYTTFFL